MVYLAKGFPSIKNLSSDQPLEQTPHQPLWPADFASSSDPEIEPFFIVRQLGLICILSPVWPQYTILGLALGGDVVGAVKIVVVAATVFVVVVVVMEKAVVWAETVVDSGVMAIVAVVAAVSAAAEADA